MNQILMVFSKCSCSETVFKIINRTKGKRNEEIANIRFFIFFVTSDRYCILQNSLTVLSRENIVSKIDWLSSQNAM